MVDKCHTKSEQEQPQKNNICVQFCTDALLFLSNLYMHSDPSLSYVAKKNINIKILLEGKNPHEFAHCGIVTRRTYQL